MNLYIKFQKIGMKTEDFMAATRKYFWGRGSNILSPINDNNHFL